MSGKAEVFKDEAGAYRYRIKASNGEILATSEAYTRPGDARRGITDLRDAVMQDWAVREQERAKQGSARRLRAAKAARTELPSTLTQVEGRNRIVQVQPGRVEIEAPALSTEGIVSLIDSRIRDHLRRGTIR